MGPTWPIFELNLYVCMCVFVSMYVCMYVCMYACVYVCRGCNFYPIAPKFGTQIGIVNNTAQFENELCESHRDSTKGPSRTKY